MDRIDAFLSIRSGRTWPGSQVVEHADGSWALYMRPGDPGRVLAEGGPVDPRSPRARFHEARAALKRLVAERLEDSSRNLGNMG